MVKPENYCHQVEGRTHADVAYHRCSDGKRENHAGLGVGKGTSLPPHLDYG